MSTSSKAITLSTPQNWPKGGFKTMILGYLYGQHSPQTSMPLNMFGITSRESLITMKNHLEKYMSFGIGLKRNGMRYQRR